MAKRGKEACQNQSKLIKFVTSSLQIPQNLIRFIFPFKIIFLETRKFFELFEKNYLDKKIFRKIILKRNEYSPIFLFQDHFSLIKEIFLTYLDEKILRKIILTSKKLSRQFIYFYTVS